MVDLRTGDLLDHDPELLMTKMAGAEYRPGTRHPDWTKALEAIPADVRDYLQLRLGQAITGHMPPDDLLVVIQGGGANGKTTIVEATARAAGSYYLLVSHRLLTASPDQHPTVLMDLQGVRYAVAEETPEARRLSVVRLKQTVGTPQISARRIGKDTVTFDAMHSLFVSTNYRPMVEETDHGTWRRLLLIRFPYTFRKSHEPLTGLKDRHGDPGLRLRLATDPAASSTVLAWLVEGARRWYEHQARGVLPEPPAGVVADTRAWQGESDQVLAYITERLRFDPKRHVAVTRPAAGLQRLALRAGPPGVVGADPGLPVRGTRRTIPAGVRKQRFRSTANTEVDVSRPERAFAATAPSQYRAYVGLRFVTRSDLAPDQAEREPVPGNPYAHGSSENPNRRDNPAQLAIPEAAAPRSRRCRRSGSSCPRPRLSRSPCWRWSGDPGGRGAWKLPNSVPPDPGVLASLPRKHPDLGGDMIRGGSAERAAQALELHLAGATYERIAGALGFANRGSAFKAVQAALAARPAAPEQSEVVQVELARMDALMTGLWPAARRGDVAAVDRVLKIGERRSQLLAMAIGTPATDASPDALDELRARRDRKRGQQ